MNKKQNLLKLFSKDRSYNYHIIKMIEQKGHLIYLIKNGSELNLDTLEFSPTKIVEELIDNCNVKIEKFAPAIFFTDEDDTEKLKYELNDKLSEDSNFSEFIESIKDEYRILEVNDSLLYKKDPEAYEEAKNKEHQEQQKDLWDEAIRQHTEKINNREKLILSYDNDLIKLMAEQFEGTIEFEKRDFNLKPEFQKIVSNLIDPETWIKINDTPYICNIEIVSLEKDRVNVYLTDNNEYSYTATLRFDKTVLVTENVVRIDKNDKPEELSDYNVLSLLYDTDMSETEEWEFKNDTEKFEVIIDYLVPLFKIAKDEKEKEYVDNYLKEHLDENNEDIT